MSILRIGEGSTLFYILWFKMELTGKGGVTQGSTTKPPHPSRGDVDIVDRPESYIMSFNVRGLNTPNKRSQVLDYLRRKKTDIALLQECHLKLEDSSKVLNHFYKSVVVSADGTWTKGVLILTRRSINTSIDKTGSDKKGHLAFLLYVHSR